jgi:hypothetical protein
MQRLDVALQDACASMREALLANCAAGGDDDLPPEDRPDRAEVAPGCLLKTYDDITADGIPCRYILPGRGIGWAYVVWLDQGRSNLGQIEAVNVTDRAPLDPLETPMPIF